MVRNNELGRGTKTKGGKWNMNEEREEVRAAVQQGVNNIGQMRETL